LIVFYLNVVAPCDPQTTTITYLRFLNKSAGREKILRSGEVFCSISERVDALAVKSSMLVAVFSTDR
jgi:hypothetical protein